MEGIAGRRHRKDTMAHKIKVKLSDAEFEAEGAEDKVQAQYDQFLQALAVQSANPSKPKEKAGGVSEGAGAPEDDARLSRIFDLGQDGLILFRAHPPDTVEAADKLALLLLGYRRLASKVHVLSTQLSRSARQSGLGDVSIDTTAKPYIPRFVLKGGQRKGTTYTLTTQGLTRAWEVAAQMPV